MSSSLVGAWKDAHHTNKEKSYHPGGCSTFSCRPSFNLIESYPLPPSSRIHCEWKQAPKRDRLTITEKIDRHYKRQALQPSDLPPPPPTWTHKCPNTGRSGLCMDRNWPCRPYSLGPVPPKTPGIFLLGSIVELEAGGNDFMKGPVLRSGENMFWYRVRRGCYGRVRRGCYGPGGGGFRHRLRGA